MNGSRTIKVLVALIFAMTLGAFALWLLETKPQPLSPTDLMALDPRGVDYQTDVPFHAKTWQNIVIHSTGPERADIAGRVHFVIEADGPQLVRPTALWKKQTAGNHVLSNLRNYNADSIGICLRGNFAKAPPTEKQFEALVDLVTSLQRMSDIPAQRVYLYSPDLSNGEPSPGKAFPARQFDSLLLRPQ